MEPSKRQSSQTAEEYKRLEAFYTKVETDVYKELEMEILSLLISSRRELSILNLQYDYKKVIGCEVPYKKLGFDSFEQYLWTIPHVCRIVDYGDRSVVVPVVCEKSKHINALVLKQKEDETNSSRKRSTIFPEDMEKEHENKTDLSTIFPSIMNLTNTEVIALLSKEIPLGMTMVNPVDTNSNLMEIVHTKSKNIQSPPLKNMAGVDFNAINELDEQPYFTSLKDNSSMSLKVKKNLRNLIEKNPFGIWCAQLLNLYRVEFKEPLKPEEYSFASVYEMCQCIPALFNLYRPDHGDYVIVDARNPKPQDTLGYFHHQNECFLPEFVMDAETPLESQWFQMNLQPEDILSVRLSGICDLSNFWVQLMGPETSVKFESLSVKMQRYFMLYHGTLRMCFSSMKPNVICAALIRNKFYRVQIVALETRGDAAQVFSLDYGGYEVVELKNLCFLPKEFAELPSQAIRASLANIRPVYPETEWSTEVVDFVAEFENTALVATIYNIDFEDKILNIVLTDTNGPRDVHINDLLVDMECAEFVNSAEVVNSTDISDDSF